MSKKENKSSSAPKPVISATVPTNTNINGTAANLNVASSLPNNPWAVPPGYYTRTDGTVIYILGPDQLRCEQPGTMSTEAQAGNSETGDENPARAGGETGIDGQNGGQGNGTY